MEMLDTPSWRWGLSLIALTMAIHATAVVMMAVVGVRVRARLESRRLKSWNLVEKAYGFSSSAIDELNKQPGTRRLPARQFALLIVGLIALVLLLYVQIIW
jgi:hypothetical protein